MTNREQPPPVRTAATPTWELVVEDLVNHGGGPSLAPGPACAAVIEDARARDAHGRRRDGVPLQAGNGRDSVWDAYEEALDLAVYLRNALAELGDGPEPTPYAVALKTRYGQALRMLLGVRELVSLREASCREA